MTEEDRNKLKSKGWNIGGIQDFLGISAKELGEISLRVQILKLVKVLNKIIRRIK